MKVFTRDYKISHFSSRVFSHYFGGLRPCVFDIEATGLQPERCKVIMTALLTEIDGGVRITQFLAENAFEEEKVLDATIEFLHREGIDYLITFNGDRYDIPFVNTRLEKLMLPNSLSLYDLDIYSFIKKETILPNLMNSLRQVMVEKYFGISKDRKDTISGKESIALFEKYAVTQDPIAEKVILTHNREDVLQLYKILCMLGKNEFLAQLKKDSFHHAIASYGIPITCNSIGKASNSISLIIRPELTRNMLKINGIQTDESHLISAAFFRDYDYPVDAEFKSTLKSLEICVYPEVWGNSLFVELDKLKLDKSELISLMTLEEYFDGCLILKDEKSDKQEAINALAVALSRSLYNQNYQNSCID